MRGWRLLFLFAVACSGTTECGGCPAQSYTYPREIAGKEPVQNAAQVRINATVLDFVKQQLPNVIPAVCCDYDALPEADRKATPAESCWGKGACFTESVSGTKRMHIYLGSPGAPLSFQDVPAVGAIDIRNGDKFPLQVVSGPSNTPAAAARPYCNDLGGEVFEHQEQDLARFCWVPSEHPAECTNTPGSPDWCCGDKFHGFEEFWPWEDDYGDPTAKLDMCEPGRAPAGRSTGYPSNVSFPLDAVTSPNNITFTLLEADTMNPAGVSVGLNAIPISIDLGVQVDDFLGASFTCRLRDEGGEPTMIADGINFTLRPRFVRNAPNLPAVLDVCPTCLQVGEFDFTVNSFASDPDLRDIDCQDSNWIGDRQFPAIYVHPGQECTTFCGAVEFLADVAEPVLELIKPLITEPLVGAISNAIVGGLNGVAVEVQTQVDPKALLADVFALRFGRAIGILAGPNTNGFVVEGVDAARGLRLSADFGIETEYDTCVPDLPAPVLAQVGDAALSGTVRVGDVDQPYHAAAAIGVHALERALFNVFRSGILCLGLGTEDIFALTNGSQKLTAGLLFFLVPDLQKILDAEAPIFFQLEPKAIPTIKLGAGVPGDSLVQAAVPDLGLSFYAFTEGRMIRLFQVKTSLGLQASLVRAPMNKLKLSIDKLDIGDITTEWNEVVAADFAEVIGPLIDIATGSILKDRLVFDLNFEDVLQSALNVPIGLRINAVQRAGPGNDFLAAYLSLCSEEQMSDINDAVCCDQARTDNMCGMPPAREVATPRLARIAYEPALLGSIRATERPAGSVTFDVGDAHDYVASIDHGGYVTAHNDGGVVTVSSPRLRIAGHHHIALQAFNPRLGDSFIGAPLPFDVEIDPEKPAAFIDDTAAGLVVRGEDLVTPKDALKLQWRTVGWLGASAWYDGAQITDTSAVRIEARAIDRAGNISDLARHILPKAEGGRSGCACRGDGADASVWLFALLWLLTRRGNRNVAS